MIVAMILAVGETRAADYYVATTGNDASIGSSERPWQTIQNAASRLRPGDTVHVRAGNYPEHVAIAVSGASNLPIVFKADAVGEVTMRPGSWTARSQSHIRIEGFHIRDMTGNRPAIEFNGDGGFVAIVSNEVSGMKSTAAAIRVGGSMHDFVIDGNHVHHNNTGNQEAIRVHERTRDFEVINNEVNDNSNIGIDIVGWSQYGKPTHGLVAHNFCHNNSTLAPWASEIYLDGPENIIVEHNVVTGSEFGYQLGCEPANDLSSGNILRYNIAFQCSEYGLMIGGFTGGEVHHCRVHNNTFVNNKRSIGFNRNAGRENVIVNNILYEPAGQSIGFNGQPRDTLIDYNCYFVDRGETPGRNSIISDPLLADIRKLDFSLLPQSPCIDSGKAIPTDPGREIGSSDDTTAQSEFFIGAIGCPR